MRVAAYIRVSTREQAEEGYSIAAQKKKLQAYAESQGWDVVQFYVDEAQSAKDMNRTNLKRMMDSLDKDMFDIVLVYRLDRLTRSVLDLYEMIKEFEKHDIKFKSATEVYDTTTATGRLFVTIIASLAQWERENLAERVSFGIEQKAREGHWTSSAIPYGYDKDKKTLKINPAEAKIVKEIYNLYIEGRGMNWIARDLNRRGIKTKRGLNWYEYTIKFILNNPIYIGNTRFNFRVNKENYFEVENAVPNILDKETFDLVQEIAKKRSQVHPRTATSNHVFTTIVKCKRCGTGLRGRSSTNKYRDKIYKTYSYICPNRLLGTCNLPLISANFLDVKFKEILRKWNIDHHLNDLDTTKENNNDENIKILNDELRVIEKRRKKWQYAWVNEMITDEDFKNRISEENKREEEIKKELSSLKKDSKETLIDVEQLKDVAKTWDKLTIQEKKQFVQLTIKEFKADKIMNERNPDSIEISDIVFL